MVNGARSAQRVLNGPTGGAAAPKSSTRSTLAWRGPSRQAASIAETASAGPENTASTSPFSQFFTQPERPSAFARCSVQARNPTPCTTPTMRTLMVRSRVTSASSEFQDDGVDRKAVAGLGENARNRGGALGAEHVLHLHR